jgi:hypothetical protein
LEESVLEVDKSVLEVDGGSDDDDKSDGEGILSGEGGGLGEAPGEFDEWTAWAQEATVLVTRQDRKQ